jgi:hypothetical protein
MSQMQSEIVQTGSIDIPRRRFAEASPENRQAPSPKAVGTGTNTPFGPVIGGDRRHFVSTLITGGETNLPSTLGHIFQTVVSRAVETGGSREIQALYQKDLFYGRKRAAAAIVLSNSTRADDTMKIVTTDHGESLVGGVRIPGGLEPPDLVLVILPRSGGASEATRLILLEAGTPGVSFRLIPTEPRGYSRNSTVIADGVWIAPSMRLGRASDDIDTSDRILFGWGAFGSAALLTLLAAQAIRFVSWSYRETPGDWISPRTSGYTFGDVILDQEASLAYLHRAAESADAYPESAHMHGYKALRYVHRATSRIVERATALLEVSSPHLATYLGNKNTEIDRLIGWQADAVPSFIRQYLPLPAGMLLTPTDHTPAADGGSIYTEERGGMTHVL